VKGKLIITADDYGMCASVNEAIDNCLEVGAVSATCVMINMPECHPATRLKERFPSCSVGIHWNLTQGRPVLDTSQSSPLVGSAGSFAGAGALRKSWLRRRIDGAAIIEELDAQYTAFTKLLGKPDFWNTHENVHVLPGLFQLFVALGRELKIPAMRCHRRLTIPRETSPGFHNLTHPAYWVKGKIIDRWARAAENNGVLMPRARLYTPGYNGTGIEKLPEIISRVAWEGLDGPLEIVVHPATAVDETLFGSLTTSRIHEFNALKQPELPRTLNRAGIEIVSFKSLHAGN
jgi:predicted glycoside hydrolase/deacetylase ChbG (UPF0249 family)